MKLFNFLNNKKDRYIAYVMIAFMIYTVLSKYKVIIDEVLLLHVAPYQLNYYGKPEGYGILALTVIIMTFIISVMNIIRKDKLKKGVAVAISGMLMCVCILVGYKIHGDLLIKYATENLPSQIEIIDEVRNKRLTLREESSIKKQIHSLVMNLEKDYTASEQETENLYRINLVYPKKYGIQMELMVSIGKGSIYFQNGNGQYQITYVEDNGIINLVKKLTD